MTGRLSAVQMVWFAQFADTACPPYEPAGVLALVRPGGLAAVPFFFLSAFVVLRCRLSGLNMRRMASPNDMSSGLITPLVI